MFLKLAGRPCLVVGAGALAEPKIESLLRCGAETLVVAPEASPRIVQFASEQRLVWLRRTFQAADLDGRFLVIAATSHSDVNDLVFQEARRRNVLCNVVDDPERCDFYYPAILRRGQLQIAISTGGQSPALAQRIRSELEQQFANEYGPWLEQLGQARRELLGSIIDRDRRQVLLHNLASREAFQDFIATHERSNPA